MNENPTSPATGRSRRGWWIAVAILAIVGALIFVTHRPSPTAPGVVAPEAQSPGSKAPEAAAPAEVTVAEAAELQGQGAFLIDVRQPEEWSEGHIAGATLIPLDDLESRIAEVPRDRKIVVVCHSGNRSRHGRDILLRAGYAQAVSMSGGLAAWEAAGRKTVTGM